MMGLYPSKNLSPESKEIYLRNLRRRIVIFVFDAIVIVGTYSYYYEKDIPNLLDSRAITFPILATLLYVADNLYVIFKKETYWQLRRRDVAKGKDDAQEILESMQRMSHGKN